MRHFIFIECGCNTEAVFEHGCDSKTGVCYCQAGVFGDKCHGKLKLIFWSQSQWQKFTIISK